MGQKDKERPGAPSIIHLVNKLYISYHSILEWWHEKLLIITILKSEAELKKFLEVKMELSTELMRFLDTILSWW